LGPTFERVRSSTKEALLGTHWATISTWDELGSSIELTVVGEAMTTIHGFSV
jgi:hypothetical protein